MKFLGVSRRSTASKYNVNRKLSNSKEKEGVLLVKRAILRHKPAQSTCNSSRVIQSEADRTLKLRFSRNDKDRRKS